MSLSCLQGDGLDAVTCVGVDTTWWGGSRANPASRRETLVAIRLGAQPNMWIETIDLSSVPNPHGRDRAEPNYDREGIYLVDALLRIIERITRPGELVVIALDAPLEAAERPGQPGRLKAVKKGESLGAARRQCETALSQHAGSLLAGTRLDWTKDLKIQSGSPVAPRIASVVSLLREHGYEVVRSAEERPARAIIEVFPSQAIWALGVLGHYPGASSQEVRAYKSKADRVMTADAALAVAQRPLGGFLAVLGDDDGLDPSLVSRWTRALAENAVACSPGREPGHVHKGKGFDDPIDSGIAALTCVAYAMGRYHVFGDGTDGTIVGPGCLSLPGPSASGAELEPSGPDPTPDGSTK